MRDPLEEDMELVLPDPVVNGDQTGIVTAIHVKASVVEPAQFIVVGWTGKPTEPGAVPTAVTAVSQKVTLVPGTNNFNTNLPVERRLLPNGWEDWSQISLNVLNGTGLIPAEEGGSYATMGFMLDRGLPLTEAIADLTAPPNYMTEGGLWPGHLLMSGEVEITTPVPAQAPAPAPAPAIVAPILADAVQTHRLWREGNELPHIAARSGPPVGTAFAFSLNEQAVVSFSFTQRARGRKVGHKCVAQTKKNRRRGTCERMVTAGTLSFTGHSGTNTVAFQGRLSSAKRLKPGHYTLSIAATNAAGRRSNVASLAFTILR